MGDFEEYVGKLKDFPLVSTYLAYGRSHHQALTQEFKQENKENEQDKKLDEQFSTDSMKNKKRDKKKVNEQDYYEVLGLEDLKYKATPEQIKKAYKEACLKYHPDRYFHQGKPDDTMFKVVQKANEILSNERQRRLYDSNDADFDDSLPFFNEKKNFYSVFGPEFEKWKKWSIKELPSLGDENTNYEMVEKFYKSWSKFQSWRDFTYNSEYDPDKAESREEKRWMERQNDKENKEYKKKEIIKVNSLLEIAKKNDPRIALRKQQLIEEKKKLDEKRKEDEMKRLLFEQQKEEERLRKIEEEKKREREERLKEIQAQKEKEKQIEDTKNKFRETCRPHVILKGVKKTGISGEDIEFVVLKLNTQEIEQFTKILSVHSEDEPKFIQVFNNTVEKLKKKLEEKEKKKQEDKKEEDKKKKEEKEVEWTVEEMKKLTIAIKQHITGKDRWERIAQDVGKSVEDVQKKTSEMKRKVKDIPQRDERHFFDEFQKVKENKLDKGKVSDDLIKKAEEVTTNYDEKVWTNEQQKEFENALRLYGKNQDKWEKISQHLKGEKTPDECRVRFEYCKELALKKKQTTTKK